MKTIISLMLLLVFTTACFAQQPVTRQTSTSADYLQKSKNQKKIAMILLGTGVALVATSIIIPKGAITGGSTTYAIPDGGYNYKNDGIKSVIGLIGVAAIAVSIPMIVISGKNKRKAMTASAFINLENAQWAQIATIVNKPFPCLTLKVSL